MDPAWTVFLHELQRHLRASNVSSSLLARRVGVDEETVRNWRKGKTHPRLAQLSIIAEALGMSGESEGSAGADALYLLREMSLLPRRPGDQELIDAAYRLQKLELKLAEAMELAGSYGRRGGAAGVVRAAVASGRWAVAVWPAMEGTRDCPLHVADRIDIRSSDGTPTSNDDVWADPGLKAALRAAYAVPAKRTPRWSTDSAASHWAISHIGSPKSPVVQLPHSGLVSVACVALVVDSWVNDVASLLATALGYGLTTTRDLAMEAYGRHSGASLPEHRRVVHEAKLERPPQRRVWSHHASVGDARGNPFVPRSGRWRSDLIFVRLRESDALLEGWVRRDKARGSLDHYVADRSFVDECIVNLRNPSQVINLEVEDLETPEQRWQQVLECVSQALTAMVDRGFLSSNLADLHQQIRSEDLAVARPVLTWLQRDGCAAVLP